MSKQIKDIKTIKQPSNKQNNNKKRGSNKTRRNNRRRYRNRRRWSKVDTTMQTARIVRRELWFQDSFTESDQMQIKKVRFDINDGPAWFKKIASMYEKYKLTNVKLTVRFSGSKMTKGMYLLTFNSNLSAINVEKDYSALAAQRGSKQVAAADQIGTININGSSLTGYSTTLPCEGADDSYAFNVILAGVPVESVSYSVEIEYKAVFYNPTISN